MNRVSLNDNSGRWFDLDAANRWDEAIMRADDGTPISRATRNSWEHETLYLAQGAFIMHFFNERNPSLSQFVAWDDKKAVQWLLANGHGNDIPTDYRKEVADLEC